MSRNARLALVLAVALSAAGLASLFVYQVVSAIPVREVEVASLHAVVAAKSIPVGTIVTSDHLKVVPWPARNPVPGAFTKIEAVVNRGAIVEVAENEPLTESKLAPLGAGGGLPPTIPEGMRAISVRTNEVVGVAGFVIPGTRVDVVVTLKERGTQTEPIARAVVSNVQVLTAGTRFNQEKARSDGKPIPSTVVTLLVTPQDAERISLAASEGQITLTLRNPLDVARTVTNGVRMANLLAEPAAPVVPKRVEGRRVVVQAPPPARPRPDLYRRGHSCGQTERGVGPMSVRTPGSVPRLAFGVAVICLVVAPIAAQNAVENATAPAPSVTQPATPKPSTPAPAVPSPAAPAPAAQATDASGFERVVLTAGRSTVLTTPFDVTRIAVTNPAVADAIVVQPREVLIDGKGSGTVSLIVWGAGQRRQYDVVVDPSVTTLQQTFQQLFPGEDIRVAMNDESIILTGRVSSNGVMLRAGEIAEGMSTKTGVINMLQLPGAAESQQVMLQVRIAEVNRRALEELGAALFSLRPKETGRVTTQQFPAPDFNDEQGELKLVFSDFLNIFFFNRKEGIGTVIKALEQKGLFQSLAEPNLIAYNGQEASFLAGGEFPVPVVQGSGLSAAVTIMFKEFGVKLNFKPTIAGDVIRLRVRPEVSSLDFNNGLTLEGFRIPALITRRAETDLELRDGQSFVMAGLLNNSTQNDTANVPFLSKIPILGNFFKSKAERLERTELMVLVTPRLVRPLDPDEVPPLPTLPGQFLPPEVTPAKPVGNGNGAAGALPAGM